MALTISRRGQTMPASPIRKLTPYADATKARGVKIYHVNIGQPDLVPPAQFWDGVKQYCSKGMVAYENSSGTGELRQKAAEKYCEMGINVSTDEVLVTTAGSEALFFAIGSVCDQGDEVIVPEPMYANYIGFAAAMGVTVKGIPTSIENGFALPDPEVFAAEITPKTRAILICNPNNPTGTIYTEEQINALIKLAHDHKLYLIADEVYREFVYDGPKPKSLLQYEGADECAIMIDSVSKRFSLCGARIGFLVTRNKEVMSAATRFAQARLSSPGMEMAGVLSCFDTPASYFDDIRAEYRKRRDLLVGRLQNIPGALCPTIAGAFYATVRLPIDDCDKFAQWLLESFEHEGETLMVAPASGFYSQAGAGKDEVRIAYVLNTQDLGRAMDLLEIALQTYPGRVAGAPAAGSTTA